ncbi:hypothetical protein SAY86_017012 [Trapa natans]|uniref:Uncharacterized protein n=1 Tax=Trapa natans TaxID=22666 RepID=A0AAN7R8E3_TRANT|nr:hypothetical protein SAY86_017012 [Trapa natans]
MYAYIIGTIPSFPSISASWSVIGMQECIMPDVTSPRGNMDWKIGIAAKDRESIAKETIEISDCLHITCNYFDVKAIVVEKVWRLSLGSLKVPWEPFMKTSPEQKSRAAWFSVTPWASVPLFAAHKLIIRI